MNWRTHDVFNQFSELSDYNRFTTERALTEPLGRCADQSSEQLTTFGVNLGSAGTYALADNANRHKPECRPSMRAVGVPIPSTSIRLGIRCLECTGSRVMRWRSKSGLRPFHIVCDGSPASFIQSLAPLREADSEHSTLWPSSACSVPPVEARARARQYIVVKPDFLGFSNPMEKLND
jgi:hypothetical protein